MSKKTKKAMSMLLVVALIAVIAVGGMLAYLTSEDSDVNVMTLGNVEIEQQEWQRAEGVSHINAGAQKGDLVPFEDGQGLYPAVPKNGLATDYSAEATNLFNWGYYSPGGNGLWNDAKLSNVMDKIVMVKNTGASDAYYRTLIAIECPEGITIGEAGQGAELMINSNGHTNFSWEDDLGYITVDGERYALVVANYKEVLTPNEVSRPSLLQVVMTHHATNEDCALFGDEFKILCLSQAAQTAGFANATEALDTAFGDVTLAKATEWFESVIEKDIAEKAPDTWDGTQDMTWFDADKVAAATEENPVEVSIKTAEEFIGFIKLANTNSFKNVTIKLEKDIDLGGQNYNEGGAIAAYGPAFSGTLDGNGHTISNLTAANNWTYANGLFRTIGNDAIIKNLTFRDVNINAGAASKNNKEYGILIGIVGSGTVRIENVKVYDSKISCKASAGILVGGMTEGAIYYKDIVIDNVDVSVSSATGKGGALLGDGWSAHDYDYAGVFTENVSVTNCTYTVAGVAQDELPLYNYVK